MKNNNKEVFTKPLAITLLIGLFAVTSANASLINQHVSVSSFERSCPGLADPNYIANHEAAITLFYGPGWLDNFTVDTACLFNSRLQEIYYNFDGTPKFDDSFPNIPAFTPEQVGGLSVYQETGTDSLDTTSGAGRLQGEISLDPSNLGLPEIKINATSEANERNSFNGYATTEFLWTGADETLEFQLNFDFFHSSQEWWFAGYEPTLSSDLFLNALVSEGLLIDPANIFPAAVGDILAQDAFQLSASNIGETSALDPYFGNLSVSFDVTAGQTFFVTAQYQGFAKNGGFLDAFNTITGGLNVEGLTQQESLAVFQTSLQRAPLTAVSSPTAFSLLMLGGGLLILRARKS